MTAYSYIDFTYKDGRVVSEMVGTNDELASIHEFMVDAIQAFFDYNHSGLEYDAFCNWRDTVPDKEHQHLYTKCMMGMIPIWYSPRGYLPCELRLETPKAIKMFMLANLQDGIDISDVIRIQIGWR